MIMAFEIITHGLTALWLVLSAWCGTMAALRIVASKVFGRMKPNDPMKVAIALLVFNDFWFSVRRVVFGSHLDNVTAPELELWLFTLVFAVLCAGTVVYVVRWYDRQAVR